MSRNFLTKLHETNFLKSTEFIANCPTIFWYRPFLNSSSFLKLRQLNTATHGVIQIKQIFLFLILSLRTIFFNIWSNSNQTDLFISNPLFEGKIISYFGCEPHLVRGTLYTSETRDTPSSLRTIFFNMYYFSVWAC